MPAFSLLRASLAAVLLAGLLAGCQSSTSPSSETNGAAETNVAPDTIAETYLTPRDLSDNVDSPAIWHGPDGQHWLLATAKETDVIIVYDATDGSVLDRIGETGTGPGQFRRPNGIRVVDDWMLVVERDNRRIQIFSLPDVTPMGSFGADQLERPYGLTVLANDEDAYDLYVTDAYEEPDESVPPTDELDRRVHHFTFAVNRDQLTSTHVRTIGDTTGAGILKEVESLHADRMHDRLLVADEHESQQHVNVYTLDGRFTGTVLGDDVFTREPEGIDLYTCADGSGYWVLTDQHEQENAFHVFDRASLDYVGRFTGATTQNTDGIVLTQRAFGPFDRGAFFAVHNDGNVAALSWGAIADALGLADDCTRRTP